MNEQGPLSRGFGHAHVSEQERERRIRAVFESVAPRYDLLNDLLSFGIHRLWKRRPVTLTAPAAGQHIVDLAGGTGDVAASMAAPGRQVTVFDPSEPIMQVGRARGLRHVGWKLGVAEQLPLADASIGKPLHELQRAHDQVRGSVAPRCLEFELHLAGRRCRSGCCRITDAVATPAQPRLSANPQILVLSDEAPTMSAY
jgi:hypothetical protein